MTVKNEANKHEVSMLEDKNVLFITTKNLDYIRNSQEIDLLEKQAKGLSVLGSRNKSYPKRLVYIYIKLLFMSLKKYDMVFVGFAPQLIVPFWNWKFRKKTLVIDFFISVYDTMVFDRKKFKDGSIIAKLCKWIDKKTLKPADYVIADTRAHGKYFQDEFGVDKDKLHVLYLEADKTIYYPRPQKKEKHFEDKFTVLYFGSILPLQGVEVVLDAVKLLEDKEDIYFIIIGPVPEDKKNECGKNVEFHSWEPQERLAEYISMADLCLAGHFNPDIQKARRTIPGKAYIYRAMDKKIILGDNPATRELYSEDENCCFVKMGDSTALAAGICKQQQLGY